MSQKIFLDYNGQKEEYVLTKDEPQKPYIEFNDYYLRLTTISQGFMDINGLSPYIQRYLYSGNKDGVLRKIDIYGNSEAWSYDLKSNINSVSLDRENNIYVAIRNRIIKLKDKNIICDYDIENNKILVKDNMIYVVKNNQLIKYNIEGKEQWRYTNRTKIKDVCIDNFQSIYLTTNNKIIKINYMLKMLWEYDIENVELIVLGKDNKIYVTTDKIIIELKDGLKIKEWNIGENISALSVDEDSEIYYVNNETIKKINKKNKQLWNSTSGYVINSIALEDK